VYRDVEHPNRSESSSATASLTRSASSVISSLYSRMLRRNSGSSVFAVTSARFDARSRDASTIHPRGWANSRGLPTPLVTSSTSVLWDVVSSAFQRIGTVNLPLRERRVCRT
jgi:hypothetical protein